MRVNLWDYDLSQTLDTFIRNNSVTGNVQISLYEKESDWINTNRMAPFIFKNGRMQWRVPLTEVELCDLVRTFELCVDCASADQFEIEEIGFYTFRTLDEKKVLKCFMKYWNKAVQLWGPERSRISGRKVEKFLKSTGLVPQMVFHAIWIRDFYKLEEFCSIFSVTKSAGVNILKAAGYQKKICDTWWQIDEERKKDILNCSKSAEDAVKELGALVEVYSQIRDRISMGIIAAGEEIQKFGMKFQFRVYPTSFYNEPAYGKRNEWIEHVLIGSVCALMIGFSVFVIKSFADQLQMTNEKGMDTIYGFWSGIIGALLAGIVTIFTTYFIIRRSYKVDYHAERIAAMPFFSLKTLFLEFHLDDENIPKKVKKFRKKHSCDWIDGSTDRTYMMISLKNDGRGPAFHMEIEGRWADYNNCTCRSMMVGEERYLIIPYYEREEVRLTYYDLYGNFYSQEFYGKLNAEQTRMLYESDPPRLELRTNRIRYRQ